MTDQEKIDILAGALRTIMTGATPTGRWLTCEDGEALEGGTEETPPEGYYNDDTAPFTLTEGKIAAEWFPYSEEEQRDWLHTCAGIARGALTITGMESQP